MISVKDAQTTKVAFSPDGEIWFADSTETPQRFDGDLETFIQRCRSRRGVIRTFGTQGSASFLALLWQPPVDGDLGIQLSSPRICLSREEQRDPQRAIYRMRHCELPASLGGWHWMTFADRATYRLIGSSQKGDGIATYRDLTSHPLWPALSFFAPLDHDATALTIGAIVDPRWHVDPTHPDRLGRLKFYLGLVPQKTGVSQKAAKGTHYPAVLRAWSRGVTSPPASTILESPSGAIWRVWLSAGGGARGNLVASQFFVTFLRYAWLDAIRETTSGGGTDPLFLPGLLLKRPEEVRAFQLHLKKTQGRLDSTSQG
jgi:hypothetical protein